MKRKKLKPWLNFMEVKQQCPKMVRPISPLPDKDDHIGDWQAFKNALKQETVLLIEGKKITEVPPMWEAKVHMECTGAYIGIFQKYLNC